MKFGLAFFMILLANFAFAKSISVTIAPLKFFTQNIAPEKFEFNILVPKGADPHTYEPKPATLTQIEKSEIYLYVGTEFDDVWTAKFKNLFPNTRFVDVSAGVEKIHFDGEECHEDHPHDHHDHEALDPHIWLDPSNVKKISLNIANALCEIYGNECKNFKANYDKFAKILDKLDEDAKAKLSNLENRKFIVYHPSWGYFAKRYDLEQIPVQIGGKEPKPKDLAALIELAKKEKIKSIFLAPSFAKKPGEIIASQSGANVVEIDHLSEDWLVEFDKMIQALKGE